MDFVIILLIALVVAVRRQVADAEHHALIGFNLDKRGRFLGTLSATLGSVRCQQLRVPIDDRRCVLEVDTTGVAPASALVAPVIEAQLASAGWLLLSESVSLTAESVSDLPRISR